MNKYSFLKNCKISINNINNYVKLNYNVKFYIYIILNFKL